MISVGKARLMFPALLLAVCGQLAATVAHADAVTDWNVIALGATAVPPNSAVQSRTLAIVHAAIHDAVRAVDRTGAAYAVDTEAPKGASIEAAVAAAAHGVLVRLAPMQRPMLDGALNAALSKIADDKGRADGLGVGAKVAEQIVAIRGGDGADATISFTPKPGPGLYQLTPQSGPAVLVHWGRIKPFILHGVDSFEFKGPPAVGSAEFTSEFDEIKLLGGRNSATRTADQTAAAIFWVAQTAVPWNAAARAASAAKGLSVAENARLFAVLALATADSQIVAFREKYRHPHWRPVTAIRAATDLGIPTLKGDPHWEPLLVTPGHPDYPSAHAMFSGAAEVVLRTFFGTDNVKFAVTFPAPLGVTRTYNAFSEMTEEVDNARVWGGIHFRSADRDGSDMGRKIGATVMRHFPKQAID